MSAEIIQTTWKNDADLERLIDAQYRRMVNAVQTDDQHAAFDKMVELVRQRSPLQIKTMEREQRLRR